MGPFEEAVREQGLFELTHEERVDDGASNMREILKLTWKTRKRLN